jgi:hypothetical protein
MKTPWMAVLCLPYVIRMRRPSYRLRFELASALAMM